MKKEIALHIKSVLDYMLAKEVEEDKYTIIMYQPTKPERISKDDKENQ